MFYYLTTPIIESVLETKKYFKTPVKPNYLQKHNYLATIAKCKI